MTWQNFKYDNDGPLSEQNVPVGAEKIKKLFEKFKNQANDTPDSLHNLGFDDDSLSHTIASTGFIDEYLFSPLPSLANIIINYSTPLIMNWAMDKNSIEFVYSPTGELISEEREKKIRNQLMDETLELFIKRFLTHGVSMICSSTIDSSIWIPEFENISIDYHNLDFFAAKRPILWNGNEEINIIEGCYNQKGWHEFVLKEDEMDVDIRRILRPSNRTMFYKIDPITRRPYGVPRVTRSLDKQKWAAERAIYSRLGRAATNALFVNAKLDEDIRTNLYSGNVIEYNVNNAGPEANLRDNMVFSPSQVEEIVALRNEIDSIYNQALKLTGLQMMKTNDDVQASVSTFAEEVAYQSSTVTMRNMVERMLNVIGTTFNNRAEKIYGIDQNHLMKTGKKRNLVHCNITHNPLDAMAEKEFLTTFLPEMRAAIEAEPDGPLAMSMFTPARYGQGLERLMRLNYVTPSILAPTEDRIAGAIASRQLRINAQNKEKNPLTIAAEAEMLRSQAIMQKNEVDLVKAEADQEIKNLKLIIDQQKNQIENYKAVNEVSSDAAKVVKDLSTAHMSLENEPELKEKIEEKISEQLEE